MRTRFNDAWVDPVGVQMHMIGKNLNLAPSYLGTVAYGDEVGMMGCFTSRAHAHGRGHPRDARRAASDR